MDKQINIRTQDQTGVPFGHIGCWDYGLALRTVVPKMESEMQRLDLDGWFIGNWRVPFWASLHKVYMFRGPFLDPSSMENAVNVCVYMWICWVAFGG